MMSHPILMASLISWQYLTVDPQTQRLYVPSTHTMVIDSESSTIARSQ